MKWLKTLVLFDKGNVASSSDWQTLHEAYVRAINRIEHPAGAQRLVLRRKTRLPSGQWDRNGVTPLKRQFLHSMVVDEHWLPEGVFDISAPRKIPDIRLYPGLAVHEEPVASDFGAFDFITTAPSGTHIAIEWETGNISSSHRSLNKLSIALAEGKIQTGVLILPSRELYEHLTDRIGNIRELSPYLGLWSGLASTVEYGLLAITVVEHDELTDDDAHPYLKSGTDGRSKQGLQKRGTAAKPEDS